MIYTQLLRQVRVVSPNTIGVTGQTGRAVIDAGQVRFVEPNSVPDGPVVITFAAGATNTEKSDAQAIADAYDWIDRETKNGAIDDRTNELLVSVLQQSKENLWYGSLVASDINLQTARDTINSGEALKGQVAAANTQSEVNAVTDTR
jgi:hypothetical protein